jgi:type II secretory pathway component GspD/PulD (secretin)
MRYIIYIFISLFFISCADVKRDNIQEKIYEPKEYTKIKTKPKRAIEYVPVKSDTLVIEKNHLSHNPHIDKIKVYGADFYDVMTLLMEATGESIILEQQNNQISADLRLKENHEVYISAENIGFGPLLQKIAADRLSVKEKNGIYYINSVQKTNIKIPPIPALAKVMQQALKTFGATNIVYDSITSSISFVAKQKDYESIMEYLNNIKKNLYVIEYDIAIYSVTLSDDFGMGIDWSGLKQNGSIQYSLGSTNTIGDMENNNPLTFGLIKDTALFDIAGLVKMLETYGKVESIQRPTLLGLAGTPVVLKDGLEETYISEITNTVLDNNIQTSTKSTTILSGIDIALQSNLLDETVITEIKLSMNEVVGYNEFTSSETQYKQPKIMTKNIENTLRVRAGEPILISGLYKNSDSKDFRGMPGVQEAGALALLGGAKTKSSSKSEMVIIVTPRVIKYIME